MTTNICEEIKALPKDLQNIIIDYHKEIHNYISSKKKVLRDAMPLYTIQYFKDGRGNLLVSFN